MNQLILDRLKAHKLRNTSVRKEVLSIFYNESGVALSNKDIEDNLESLDRITLYRTLKTFEKSGLIHQVIDGTGVSKYALCSHQCTQHEHHDIHAHFYCESCEQTTCLEDIHVNEPILSDKFKINSAQLVINGVCDLCHL